MEFLLHRVQENVIRVGFWFLGADKFLRNQADPEQKNVKEEGLRKSHGKGRVYQDFGKTKKAAPYGATLFKEAKWQESEGC